MGFDASGAGRLLPPWTSSLPVTGGAGSVGRHAARVVAGLGGFAVAVHVRGTVSVRDFAMRVGEEK